ncbi:lysophospholipase L1-like esterase [Peribacillus deserti]|uniref:Lysophospholipase L1-like esterase n=1 Tax=Peribacillus deserti TaxID=673318 RepID=A0ABS2QFY0_9BACI|nr:GDSL-type esterase/lipase family protein [Peribacillus deserti]MBM7692060.1 lysophospholipase L1-like esterase [Peribacillus deserti]
MKTQSAAESWVGSWSISPVDFSQSPFFFNNQTVRAAVRLSIGGNKMRLKFSNRFGGMPVVLSEVHVFIHRTGLRHPVLFQGSPMTGLQPYQEVIISDPIDLEIHDLEEVKVSMFFSGNETIETAYQGSSRVASIPGNSSSEVHVQEEHLHPEEALPLLTGIELYASETCMSVVTFGDSITAMDWPDCFAEILAEESMEIGVLRQGIGGNKVLTDSPEAFKYGVAGVERFKLDALNHAGVKAIIVLHGVNDIIHSAGSNPISQPVDAEEIIEGLKQYIGWAHEENIRICGATLLPFGGYEGITSIEENKRRAINDWIRNSGEFDAVIDFDRAVRNPDKPLELLPAYDSGDHLHPSREGAEAMARSIDINLFV